MRDERTFFFKVATKEEAVEWIDYNSLRAIGYFGENAPIIMYPIVD